MLLSLTPNAAVAVGLTYLLLSASAVTAQQAPPPPWIVEAAKHLILTQTTATFDQYADELAADVTVSVNGQSIAVDKADWLAKERPKIGNVERQVIGYANGWDSIIVFDSIDDKSELADNPLRIHEPLYVTRSLRYQFGPDHKIHSIRIMQTAGKFKKSS